MPDEAITLLQYTTRLANAINAVPDLKGQWVQAETSDMKERYGHCYLELIEKNPETGQPLARLQAIIWANMFGALRTRFEQVTGARFTDGIKVLVKLNAHYHQQYGLKAVIADINPEYTLGDAARMRREILERLQREGLLELNRQRPFPPVPQRIAVVSAEGAAGYGDFADQIARNTAGVKFYTRLFPAVMQGTNTANSVIAALRQIEHHVGLFDCVVIIRGGGATSDLGSFDNYDLAAAVARCPLPVVVGIGHERDTTVLDDVAAVRVKTPTAAAEWLIGRGEEALRHLTELTATVAATVREHLAHSREQLTYYQTSLRGAAQRVVGEQRLRLSHLTQAVPLAVQRHTDRQRQHLSHLASTLPVAVGNLLLHHRTRVDNLADKLLLLSPRNILRRGYTLTMHHGHFVTDAAQLQPGDIVTTHFANGRIRAAVQLTQTDNKQPDTPQ